MNIDGLDYNTQREKLLLPEYGREIQDMVNHCKALTDKDERQQCAETIVSIMDRMNPQNRETPDHAQKLWDHLAIMANFELDIDYPYDVSQALKIAAKPEPMTYPMSKKPCAPLWKNDVRPLRTAQDYGRRRGERRIDRRSCQSDEALFDAIWAWFFRR